MGAPILTAADRNEIVRLYKLGVNTSEIAEMFGVRRSYPTTLAQRYGATLRRPLINLPVAPKKPKSAPVRETADVMWLGGLAGELGIRSYQITKMVQHRGLAKDDRMEMIISLPYVSISEGEAMGRYLRPAR